MIERQIYCHATSQLQVISVRDGLVALTLPVGSEQGRFLIHFMPIATTKTLTTYCFTKKVLKFLTLRRMQ